MNTNLSPTFAAIIHLGCDSLKGAKVRRGRDGLFPRPYSRVLSPLD